jgi:hypothetical protein
MHARGSGHDVLAMSMSDSGQLDRGPGVDNASALTPIVPSSRQTNTGNWIREISC